MKNGICIVVILLLLIAPAYGSHLITCERCATSANVKAHPTRWAE
jgi:hypothetical protein